MSCQRTSLQCGDALGLSFQMANGKEQITNVKPFEFCHLPFEIAL
jgi:hypothetical protein